MEDGQRTQFIFADYRDNASIKLNTDIYDLVVGANFNQIFTGTEELYALG